VIEPGEIVPVHTRIVLIPIAAVRSVESDAVSGIGGDR
jgi:hypothetical protein